MHPWLSGPWSMKLFYFWFFCAAGIYFPYLGLYLKAIHGVLYDRVHAAGIFLVAGLICVPALLGLALLVPNLIPELEPGS